MGKDITTNAYVQGPSPDDPGKKEDVPSESADFDNLLRVDESDEPPKEGKKSKTEEEEEKKDKKSPETEVPTSEAFQRFMDGKKGDEGILGVKAPQKTRGIQTTTEVATPEPSAKSAKKAPAPQQEELVYVPQPEEPAPAATATTAPAPQPTTSTKSASTSQPTASAQAEQEATPTPSEQATPTPSQKYSEPDKTQPSSSSQQESTPTTSTTQSGETETSTTSDEGEPPTTETEPDLPGDTPKTFEAALKEAAPLPSITEDVENVFEELGSLTSPAAKKGAFKKVDFPIDPATGKAVKNDAPKTDKEVFMAEIGAFPEGTVPTSLPAAPIPGATPTNYTSLSRQVRELFDYMVGTIIVKKDSDQTTTTVMVNLKGSVFDGSKIVLTRYASSPDSLNIQLQGNPQAVNLFSENLHTLRKAFMEKQLKIHLQPPNLLDEYFEKRKKKAKTVSRKEKPQ
ncbi:MAG: hypothetical protein ChlgKO_13150 [Chlamydiales bacterium]